MKFKKPKCLVAERLKEEGLSRPKLLFYPGRGDVFNRVAYKLLKGELGILREEEFKEIEEVKDYIITLKEELIKNIQIFTDWEKAKGNIMIQNSINKILNMFRVNVLVDNSETQGAPVVYERVPTLKGLFGQINYKAEMGILYADHLSLAPGKLHQANGGYLILNLWEILKNPYPVL